MAVATSDTSAPVLSQMIEMEFMLEIFWARKAFAVSLDNSEDQVLVDKMRSKIQ